MQTLRNPDAVGALAQLDAVRCHASSSQAMPFPVLTAATRDKFCRVAV